MKRLGSVGMSFDEKRQIVENLVAKLYIYPDVAYVELSPKLSELLFLAKVVRVDEEGDLEIDDKKYLLGIEKDVFALTEELSEEHEKKVAKLYEEFKLRGEVEPLAYLLNSNDEFEVAAIVRFEELTNASFLLRALFPISED